MESNMETKRMVELFEPLAKHDGITETVLDNVMILRAGKHLPRYSIVYEPFIFIIAQGRKKVFLGDEIYRYDPDNYLVVSTPLPMECETIASPEEPLLGIKIKVDPVMISELLIKMDNTKPVSKITPRGVYSSKLTVVIKDAVIRLLECLNDPVDGQILGPQIVREIVYRLLCDEQGEALRLLAVRHGRFSQMAKVLNRIHADFGAKLNVENLAEEANMSISSFHNNFKTVTSKSPIQYIKDIRLQKARMLMVQDGISAVEAAFNVGYESASQFSREFKRHFGHTPADEAVRMRNFFGDSFVNEAAS
ncbi:MAG: AraC family transcriptional regulator [Desulfobacteraceae bacterium]|jgi:AraC-like DNA-binding protein